MDKETQSIRKYWREYMRKYRASHRELINVIAKRSYWKHREAVLERARKDRLANPERYKAYSRKQYWKKHPEGRINRLSGTGLVPTKRKVLARDSFICQVCGEKATDVHFIDGTGSNKPMKEKNLVLDNLISVCHKCGIGLAYNRIGSFSKNRKEDKKRNFEIYKLSNEFSQTLLSKIFGLTRQRIEQIIKKYAV